MLKYIKQSRRSYLHDPHNSNVPVCSSVQSSHHVEEPVIKETSEEPLVDKPHHNSKGFQVTEDDADVP